LLLIIYVLIKIAATIVYTIMSIRRLIYPQG